MNTSLMTDDEIYQMITDLIQRGRLTIDLNGGQRSVDMWDTLATFVKVDIHLDGQNVLSLEKRVYS